jgi:hypothetical protein
MGLALGGSRFDYLPDQRSQGGVPFEQRRQHLRGAGRLAALLLPLPHCPLATIRTAPRREDLLWCPEQGGWHIGEWCDGRWLDSLPYLRSFSRSAGPRFRRFRLNPHNAQKKSPAGWGRAGLRALCYSISGKTSPLRALLDPSPACVVHISQT